MSENWDHINKLLVDLPIVWINLNRAERRRTIMQKKLDNLNNKIFRIEGVDGKLLKMEDIKKKYNVNDKLSIYEVACALSHLKAVKFAYEKNFQRVIILEDDATFEYFKYHRLDINSLFTEIAGKGGECVQLANITQRKILNRLIASGGLYWRRNEPGAQAYILNRNGMKKVIDNFSKTNTILLSEHMVFRTANTYVTRPYFSYPFLRDEKGDKVNISFIRANTKCAHATQTISKLIWDKFYKESSNT